MNVLSKNYNKTFKINKNKCIHCLKFKVIKQVKCAMCSGNICYETECRLYFDFYTKQYLCVDCTHTVDRNI